MVVYYEAFCPDSKDFIADQLWPAYQRMPDTLHVELLPYGKAKVCCSWRHGPPDEVLSFTDRVGCTALLSSAAVQYREFVKQLTDLTRVF